MMKWIGILLIFFFIKKLTGQFKEQKDDKKPNPVKPETDTFREFNIPPAPSVKRSSGKSDGRMNESHNKTIRLTALRAVRTYLQSRNYKVLEAENNEFDLIAIDTQDKELGITVIAFENKDNDNVISLTAEQYKAASKMGRSHRLFVITDCFEDEDSEYLGNYVTLYYLDSPIDEVGFKQQGAEYTNTLRKLKKYSYDQEVSVRLLNEI